MGERECRDVRRCETWRIRVQGSVETLSPLLSSDRFLRCGDLRPLRPAEYNLPLSQQPNRITLPPPDKASTPILLHLERRLKMLFDNLGR